ncbi:MAG: TetR/AcrR family transcriptional regulator [Alphaproteobacteria bacterium]|nr:TetR/AcrR family transcriptional regulator [Alphaproteobacteria bacterium]MBO7097179.1 TetR/AcrR family transcriptional regulator [Alphaproteobacteria bacterium]
MVKDNIQENLIQTGRDIVKQKGVEFLTARKLSEASGYSVGTIYNQFGNMDNFILIQNYLTLDALYKKFIEIKTNNAYERLNLYVEVFADFVTEHRNFWFMVYKFHLNQSERSFSVTYLKRISKMIMLIDNAFKELYPKLKNTKRQVSVQVLWISLFALSSLLTTDSLQTYSKLNKTKICFFLLNTYLTGIKFLEKLGDK